MRWDMGASTLSALAQRTQDSSDDLGALIKQLVAAAEPLEGRFNGAGKAAFDAFKNRSDEITAELNGALNSILGGQHGMDRSFHAGETAMVDDTKSAMGAAQFDAARFRA